jgi:hypothetical protein
LPGSRKAWKKVDRLFRSIESQAVTPGVSPRRRGQKLAPDEEKVYRRVVQVWRRLELRDRWPGAHARAAAAAGVDLEVVRKAVKWARRRRLL